jgi:TonB family protein
MKTKSLYIIIILLLAFSGNKLYCDEHEIINESGVEAQCDMTELQKAIVYPDSAAKNKIEGKVVINVLIDTAGYAKEINIISTTDEVFNESAINAVKSIKYKPALKLIGTPILSWLQIPILYKLK